MPRPKKTAIQSASEPAKYAESVQATVSRQYTIAKQTPEAPDVKNEQVTVKLFITEPAKVALGMGLTLNLGNYEAARVDVSLLVPCYREEADEAYKFAYEWVQARLGAEVEDIRSKKPHNF
jgi:hypothetical protein